MTTLDLTEKVIDMIEHLRKARPGTGPAEERAAHRATAEDIRKQLPKNWHNRVKEDIWSLYVALV